MYKILSATTLAILTLSTLSPTVKALEMPTQADIAAKQRETLDVFKRLPTTNKELQQQVNSNGTAAKAAATLTAIDPRSPASKEDFMRLARPNARVDPAAAPAMPPQADLMVFVSLSMPDQMLEQYAVQAKRFGAVLMMRGFVNDKLSDTKAALLRVNRAGAKWEISPEPFTQFKIDKVPAIVMATAESGSITEEGCARPETYTTIFGDMSILDALDKMALRGQKTISEMAKSRIGADRQSAKTQ